MFSELGSVRSGSTSLTKRSPTSGGAFAATRWPSPELVADGRRACSWRRSRNSSATGPWPVRYRPAGSRAPATHFIAATLNEVGPRCPDRRSARCLSVARIGSRRHGDLTRSPAQWLGALFRLHQVVTSEANAGGHCTSSPGKSPPPGPARPGWLRVRGHQFGLRFRSSGSTGCAAAPVRPRPCGQP